MSLRPSSLSPASCSGLMYSGVPTTRPVFVTFCAVAARRLRDAEVHDLHQVAAVARLGDHDVVGLEIAVHDAHVVRDGERVGRLADDRRRRASAASAPACSMSFVSGAPVDELHREVDDARRASRRSRRSPRRSGA